MSLRDHASDSVKLTLVASAAYLCGFHFTGLFHPTSAAMGGLWALISGIVVLQADWQSTWASARLRILGSLIGAIVSAVYLSFLPFGPLGMTACILAAVLLCHAAGIPDPARLAAITVALIMVVSSLDPAVPPVTSAALRFTESFLGAAMALLAARLWSRRGAEAAGKDG